ncbi:MAG: peptidoglycan DD-metalloendopeptidase family protein [Paludibacteraceae bacterium]|nr:peptidoglycan DD-metalloendopeptidase family protein [Paludibacteraceae bacterium]
MMKFKPVDKSGVSLVMAALMLVWPASAQELSEVEDGTEPDEPTETEEFFDVDEAASESMGDMGLVLDEGTWRMPRFCDSLPEACYNDSWDHFVVNPYDKNLMNMTDSVNIDMTGYCHPIAGYVTSKFGFRRYRFHYGTDVKLNVGDSIRASFDGVVRISKNGYGYGNYILIRHNNGLETIYGHCSKLLVAVDSTVHAGDVIALGGNTGRSTGPHLHFEVRYVGNAIDPQSIIDFETGQPKTEQLEITATTFKYKKEIASMAFYTVRKGDTLSGIAKKRHTTVSKLCKLNGIKPTTILKIGRRLRCS